MAETRSGFVMWTAAPHENGHSYVSLYIQSVEMFLWTFYRSETIAVSSECTE
jgi:hypothetical protein